MNNESFARQANGAAILRTLRQYELINVDKPSFNAVAIPNKSINKNYKITDGEQTLLLKVFDSRNNLPIDRSKVFKLQEELAILGLAPTPLFINEDKTIYCEQWITFSSVEQKDLCKHLADALYTVHNSFVSAPLLALDDHWKDYWGKLEEPSLSLCEQYAEVQEKWQSYVEQNKDNFVLCHNDLHSDHVSYPNGPLFDWEYAGLGCRYFDIASCCAINEFNSEQRLALCKHYAELANMYLEELIVNVKFADSFVSFTYQLWGKSLGIEHYK